MPTFTPDYATGGNATVTIGGVDVHCKDWTVNKKYTLEDVTTTGDYNATTGLVNMRDIAAACRDEITFNAFVDMSNDVLATLEAGDAEIANVVVTFRTGKTRTYPLIILESIDMRSGGVVGANSYAVKARSQGQYTTS